MAKWFTMSTQKTKIHFVVCYWTCFLTLWVPKSKFQHDSKSFISHKYFLYLINRGEHLFINLIRKILTKDFISCDNDSDVCSIYDDSESIHTRHCFNDSPSSPPDNCILSSILKTQMLVSSNFPKMEILDKFDEPIHCDISNQSTLEDYKIGSTALDCSIMITLRRINGYFDVRWGWEWDWKKSS